MATAMENGKLLPELRRMPHDRLIFWTLFAIGLLMAAMARTTDFAGKQEVAFYIAGIGFVNWSVLVTLPFATGSQPTSLIHAVFARLFVAAVVVHSFVYLLYRLPSGLIPSNGVAWPLFLVFAISGGFSLFVGAPLSAMLYGQWLSRERRASVKYSAVDPRKP
jgi:hypothetical protein